jgi:hypothetical protein
MNGEFSPVNGEMIANTTVANDQRRPSVVRLASGGFVVIWDDFSKTGGDTDLWAVRAQLFNAEGARVGEEFLVNTATYHGQQDSHVAALANGGFVITWSDVPTGFDDMTSVKAQIYDAAGARVGSEITANTTIIGDQFGPNVSGLPGGGFVIVWTDRDQASPYDLQGNIFGQIFSASGQKVGGEFLVNSLADIEQTDPKVTTLADGRFVVTWTHGGRRLDE